jgi:transcriptional regulator GlxA family with amidase domain
MALEAGAAPLRVAILLWPSFPLMSLAGLVESLRHAADRGDASAQRYARWDVLGAPGSRTVSSCGIPVEATASYIHPDRFDYVFVIGGLLRDLSAAPGAHRDYLRAADRAGRRIVGVCTGAFVLAEEGVLRGGTACVHPYHRDEFREAFPGIRLATDAEFEEAGRAITVPGGVCILTLMTRIIAERLGPDRAAKTVHQMTLPARGRTGPPPDWVAPVPGAGATDPRVQSALVALEARATENPSVAALARSLGVSERHLLRLFRREVGRAPKDYIVDMKLRAAVWMLRNTGRPVTAIAYAAGFSSGATLAAHCRRRLRATPSQIRRDAAPAATPAEEGN